jgi:hypothetical protein
VIDSPTIRAAARKVDEVSPGEALNAPLFRALLERMQTGSRAVVLDLGPARPETIAVLGGFRCRLDIADLTEGLEELNAEPDRRRLRTAAEAMLPPRRPEPVDIVLCWDILNYLRPPALTAVMECVAARGGPGTLTHGLVVYSAKHMSVRPGRFVPLPDHTLANLAPPGEQRTAPRYSPEDLARCMPGFNVERARLLRNGMQEFLFRL